MTVSNTGGLSLGFEIGDSLASKQFQNSTSNVEEPQKIGDLPLKNVDYVCDNNQQPHRATTKEAGHEKGYHFCRS
jgi:hypothetical protein